MPNKFTPISGSSDLPNTVAQINKNFAMLDNENVVKVFQQGDTSGVVIGRYSDNRYGMLISDASGTPRILIGQAPDDSRPGIWISNAGENVITLLGG